MHLPQTDVPIAAFHVVPDDILDCVPTRTADCRHLAQGHLTAQSTNGAEQIKTEAVERVGRGKSDANISVLSPATKSRYGGKHSLDINIKPVSCKIFLFGFDSK